MANTKTETKVRNKESSDAGQPPERKTVDAAIGDSDSVGHLTFSERAEKMLK